MTAIDRRVALTGVSAAILAGVVPVATAEPPNARIEVHPELGELFANAGTSGTFAALDLADGRIVVSDRARAETAFLPASTFKVPNSLIALETGIATDADNPTFQWDRVVREFDAWNRDHTLRSAIKVSSIPTYQEIARRIGAERMQRYVDAFDYGNHDLGGAPIDMFWLNGQLRITAMQQVAFLQRLYRGELSVSKRTQEIVKDVMLLEQGEFGTLRGKTGAVGIGVAEGSKASLGWLVGWLERGNNAYLFAMNIDIREQGQLAQRAPLTKALLERAIAR